ncbi:MAG: phosphoribosylanthranilate isomerase [Cyclobacteriaceae bacterium]
MNKPIRLKICGMREHANIHEVSRFAPDYMGFIFYPHSRRYVGDRFHVPATLPASIQRVGVFVNAEWEEVRRMADLHRLDYVQLHGHETVAYCQSLRETGIQIIKVFGVGDGFSLSQTEEYQPHVKYFLFDTKVDGYGGSGTTFDWSVLSGYKGPVPYFLSGGIDASNIHQIPPESVRYLHGVDVNSTLEISPAVKDPGRVFAFQHELNLVNQQFQSYRA